jgi:hypothetical protein
VALIPAGRCINFELTGMCAASCVLPHDTLLLAPIDYAGMNHDAIMRHIISALPELHACMSWHAYDGEAAGTEGGEAAQLVVHTLLRALIDFASSVVAQSTDDLRH